MKTLRTTRMIDAPPDRVFEIVSNVENFAKAVPQIVKVERLSEAARGVGVRFRETRLMKGREATTELEITEFIANERVRLVSEAGGAIWDSLFAVTPRDGGSTLELAMEARPQSLIARLTTPLIMGVVGKAVESDMDAVKAYCEGA